MTLEILFYSTCSLGCSDPERNEGVVWGSQVDFSGTPWTLLQPWESHLDLCGITGADLWSFTTQVQVKCSGQWTQACPLPYGFPFHPGTEELGIRLGVAVQENGKRIPGSAPRYLW
jgi:hypothetical protein